MEAIDIAINTPDIAIIQGPPGTGKTTIIRAIVERLHELHSDDLRILISSTQHEAVDNAIRGMKHCGLPPIRIQNGRGKAVRGDQQNKAAWLAGLTEACDAILKEAPENKISYATATSTNSLKIRREGVVNLEACEGEIKELQQEMQSLGYDESIIDRIHALQERFIEVRHGAEDSAEDDDRLASLLSAQCRTSEEFCSKDRKSSSGYKRIFNFSMNHKSVGWNLSSKVIGCRYAMHAERSIQRNFKCSSMLSVLISIV